MGKFRIRHDTLVFVGDGRKALFLRNQGDEVFLNLKTEQVFVDHNPPTREQGTDKPGRSFSRVGPGRSAVEPTDWHDIEEHRFVDSVAQALENYLRVKSVKGIVIVAPPRALAELRRAYPASVANCVIAEIDKDLTKLPIDQIEKHLQDCAVSAE